MHLTLKEIFQYQKLNNVTQILIKQNKPQGFLVKIKLKNKNEFKRIWGFKYFNHKKRIGIEIILIKLGNIMFFFL